MDVHFDQLTLCLHMIRPHVRHGSSVLLAPSMIHNIAGSVISETSDPGGGEVPHTLDPALMLPAEFTPQGSHERFIVLIFFAP